MAWVESLGRRRRTSRTYQNTENPLKRRLNVTQAALHYESDLDSGIHDAEVDLTPERIDNPQFDGWRIEHCGWRFAMGKDLANHGDQDGWVGFGGRSPNKPGDAHWFKFRLARVGYLHWPTRNWGDVGGPPAYNRANLSQEVSTLIIGPNGDEIRAGSSVNWANIWTTPGGGELSIQWRIDGDRLKEDVVINQAAREWVAANRPPSTPLAETWFGFVFQVDLSDIPRIVRDGILQDPAGDFADDGQEIVFQDALERLLAFMPLSDVRVIVDAETGEAVRQPLRKRFWRDPATGIYYLLVGARCDVNMLPGDQIYDPTINDQVGASTDDAAEIVATSAMDLTTAVLFGQPATNQYHCGLRFAGISGLSGATIDTALTKLTFMPRASDTSTVFVGDWYAHDAAAPGTFTTDASNISGRARTTATCEGDGNDFGDWTNNVAVDFIGDGTNTIGHIIQELANDYDPSAIALLWIYTSGTQERIADSWDQASADAPKLQIEYTAAGVAVPPRNPVMFNTYAMV